ncbi:emerin (Emery-Dreifuss muscular dystrophy) [Brienomyrus brachyistius]|uniref:emerin (Emery-Dreifuss muscular dystrophy) n=1 Tax=Brienomyrus brachyistius TaxID=42636 RepID=UPI0020B21972|nr:emerin (Emery-Dreifuss muscular dystrophy) [Brienomyrus brachyistius]
MSTLSSKSDREISQLLDDYGIKHGPVVGTTRTLYEKKLKEAMAKGSREKPPSDKTYYREEQEEVTYVHYRTPLRSEGFGESSSVRHHITPEFTRESDMDYAKEPSFHRTAASYSQVSHSKPALHKLSRDVSTKQTVPQQSRFIPLWFQFLVFLVVAAFLYFVFTNMETPAANPFSKLE